MPIWRFSFGPFTLDLATGRLLRDGRVVAVGPRDLAVLRHLVVRAGQVASTDEILESAWPDTFVVRGVVKAALNRLRSALGDSHVQAAYIETVGRMGYRFIADVRSDSASHAVEAVESAVSAGELAALCSRFAKARDGERQVVFVRGDIAPETTRLVEAFLSWVELESAPLCARGHCILQLGSSEPYRPLLEALQSLARGPLGAEVVAILRRHAPLWLAQLPGLVAPAARESLTRESRVSSPARMQREFQDAIDALTAVRPVVLVLENLHRSDRATLDLVTAIATRRDASRLLVLATHGSDELAALPSSFTVVLHELLARGLAEELSVSRAGAEGSEASARNEQLRDTARTKARLSRPPFVGRGDELALLARLLETTRRGSGGIAFVVGEPGIGKTRLLEELGAHARAAGARVLQGRCYDGQLARPFGPIAEAIAAHASESDEASLREDVGAFAGIVARVVPELRDCLPDFPESPPLSPDEERRRLLDALVQVLWSIARRGPLVLILDDLHWADGATAALIRHAARFLPRHSVLVLGAYRDSEVDRGHLLAEALTALRRDIDFERIALSGLGSDAVTELLSEIAIGDAPKHFVDAIVDETGGNPLFLRELMLHLLEEGTIGRAASSGQWQRTLGDTSVPDGVRDVVARRLANLSESANRLLATASGCPGAFRLDVVAAVAELDERSALDALDEALAAQLVRETGAPESYEFTHALLRHALYTDLSSSRRVRLHRRLAEQLERCHGENSAAHPLEIAQHWHRSAALPGAEAGVKYCQAAADRAEAAAAHEDAAAALRMALDLAPTGDSRQPRLLARLGLALAWSPAHEEAVRVASEAAELIAASEGADAAADYLADAAEAVHSSTFDPRAWGLAEQGLNFAGPRRDLTWARLASLDIDRRDAADSYFPGAPLDAPERRLVSQILVANWLTLHARGVVYSPAATVFESRADASERGGVLPIIVACWAGEFRRAVAIFSEVTPRFLERGQLAAAAFGLSLTARCHLALGNATGSAECYARAAALVDRLGNPPFLMTLLTATPLETTMFRGEGYEFLIWGIQNALAGASAETLWMKAMALAAGALCFAHSDRRDDARDALESVLPAIERASGWAPNYTAIISLAIEALWVLERVDFAESLERNLREKTLAPDFRYVFADARLSLARLCALTGRIDEARHWFADARRVLDEQGARPLRAIVDLDEARMEIRRGGAVDSARALVLLDAACSSFDAMGMTGWRRRADELRQTLVQRA